MSRPEPKWKVGDPVVVEVKLNRGSRIDHGTVTKVARKYFYVKTGRWKEEAYEIATGREKGQPGHPSNYVDCAYTPEEWETITVRRELIERIRAHRDKLGVQYDNNSFSNRRWSTLHLLELLQLLDRVADEAETLDLDAPPIDRL